MNPRHGPRPLLLLRGAGAGSRIQGARIRLLFAQGYGNSRDRRLCGLRLQYTHVPVARWPPWARGSRAGYEPCRDIQHGRPRYSAQDEVRRLRGQGHSVCGGKELGGLHRYGPRRIRHNSHVGLQCSRRRREGHRPGGLTRGRRHRVPGTLKGPEGLGTQVYQGVGEQEEGLKKICISGVFNTLSTASGDISQILRFCSDFFLSTFFASSQSLSSSSIDVVERVEPPSATLFSTWWNLVMNFPIVFLSASSGLTSRKRATFTIVNKRSPNSSSIPAASLFFTALENSATSSPTFSSTPETSFQSKPTFAAFSLILWALRRAGSTSGTPERIPPSSPPPAPAALSFSFFFISAQWTRTSSGVDAALSPKTCGWRRTIFSCDG